MQAAGVAPPGEQRRMSPSVTENSRSSTAKPSPPSFRTRGGGGGSTVPG